MIPADPSGKPISLHPDDLHRVAVKFAHGQDQLDGISDTLNNALQNAGGMAGNDDYGHDFGKKYDPAADALFRTLAAACRAIGQHATGLVTTANNYIKADHHSDAKASKAGPHTYPVPMVFADVVYPTPATAIGPGHSDVPDMIAKYWPNGHQDKLRTAADSYRTAAGKIDDLGHHLHQQVVSITDNNSDDSVDAMADFWASIWRGGHGADKAPLSAAKHACDQLAQACDSFAQAIDDAHSETESKLAEAGIAITLTTAIGVLLTPFTFGGSDAGAVALDSAEAAAILGSVEVALDESVAAIGTDMIADVEVYLQAAAEGVPEVEAVDAETTEVSQALERELAETEARTPGGSRGSGGGKPPTGGGRGPGSDAEPPPAKEPGGLTSDALGGARERRVADLTDGEVPSGEPGKPGIKITQPGAGTSDVDVIGGDGSYIQVGGPAKARNLAKLGQKLNILKWAAAEDGVGAQAYFEEGTPESALKLARKILGPDNVHVFSR